MRHVLLFEDEHDIAIGLRRTLEDHGYYVSVTARLNDARQMLKRVKFDLIIVNILLAGDAAFEVVEMAKERGISTFLMTGSSSQSSRSHAAVAKTGSKLLPEARLLTLLFRADVIPNRQSGYCSLPQPNHSTNRKTALEVDFRVNLPRTRRSAQPAS